MSRNPSYNGGLDWGVYAQERYEVQMLEWLEFAWSNRNNHDYKTPQTERFSTGSIREGRASRSPTYLGSQKSMSSTNRPYGTKMLKTINTHALYEAWKKQSDAIKSSYLGRCYLPYEDAVPEMHVFLDYMKERLP